MVSRGDVYAKSRDATLPPELATHLPFCLPRAVAYIAGRTNYMEGVMRRSLLAPRLLTDPQSSHCTW